jgi:hypothetical protein
MFRLVWANINELGSFCMLVLSGSKETAQFLVPLAIGVWFVWRKGDTCQEGKPMVA